LKWEKYIVISDEMKVVIAKRKKTWVDNEFKDELMRRKSYELLTQYDNQDKIDIHKIYSHF
jgi:hypothetical protein